MSHDVAIFLSAAWQAINTADEIICDHWHQPRLIDYKGPIDLITSVDSQGRSFSDWSTIRCADNASDLSPDKAQRSMATGQDFYDQ